MGNLTHWQWCERGRHWVLDYPFPAGLRWCGECYYDWTQEQCYYDWTQEPNRKREEQQASDYLIRDYAQNMI